MNSVQGYKGFITFLILSGILFTVFFGFNYISQTQNTDTKASVPATIPLNITYQNISTTSVEIVWTTQEPVQGIVAFSMSDNQCENESNPCIEVKESDPTTSHFIKLINLNSNTEYFFHIKSTDNKYYPQGESVKFITTEMIEPLTQIKKSAIDESSGITVDEKTDFEGIIPQATFQPLLENNNVLGRSTTIVDQMVTNEFKDAVIFNDIQYDFNNDGSVTVYDYPLFIEFINNRED
ncbi:hypothetical protein CO058_02975 [candidate division WWE3 bacterium CG_4_9_14_0_2_um_filter_35_11]|uniref:Fibronectin type-III domain-containing protein n=1 Tax=candidate division WWE3 bacterium CG_4_9_14_0_2_um_filter_35_11 TaxID=1975077 RepID=A0A2M8ELF4_UNCKA|nr:MAG: hypothetical protein COV25_01905 [candidate division WWE3 bacterium CG10_big_fil_rev_8_21_14_0_10_35_32]PJC23545.1 MAG: hypothetical protein CO058_02975 [candidate division WWE3 bacterium CG_4_9_14_0_2_um_filter_35_11]